MGDMTDVFQAKDLNATNARNFNPPKQCACASSKSEGLFGLGLTISCGEPEVFALYT